MRYTMWAVEQVHTLCVWVCGVNFKFPRFDWAWQIVREARDVTKEERTEILEGAERYRRRLLLVYEALSYWCIRP